MMQGAPTRRGSARAVAIVVAALLLFGLVPGTSMGVEKELKEARQELRETRERIRAKGRKLNALQRELNRLGTEMTNNQAQINEAEERMSVLERNIAKLEVRTERLQDRLDERNRQVYIQGPGAPVLYLLTATSAADAVNRVSIINEMNRRDGILAHRVEQNAERLSRSRAEMLRLQRARQLAIQQLEVQQRELHRTFAQVRALQADLKDHKEEVLEVVRKYRPFATCPVGDPHALTDSFGIWVHRSKERGGDHVHQGIDIMAPGGTPIYAPFPGTAVAVPNKLGGNAVNVYGEFGYVYNAHLSRYGTLGPVQAGDVIGYVGATGNTSANHDHFEWHPNDGDAADPYPFLVKIC